jgi:hypothetical protein
MFDGILTHNALSVRTHQRTDEERVSMSEDRDNDDWGARALWWLRQRFPNWPLKAIARHIDEPESVVVSWWNGTNLPSRKKLQKLNALFARDGFSSFVFGAPSRDEVTARLETLNRNLVELRDVLNAMDQRSAGTPMRVVGRAPRTSG